MGVMIDFPFDQHIPPSISLMTIFEVCELNGERLFHLDKNVLRTLYSYISAVPFPRYNQEKGCIDTIQYR